MGTGLDLTADAVRQLQRQVEEAGIAFMAEFARRHSPATLRLKELIATRLGPPELLFCHQRLPADDHSTHCPRNGCNRSTKQELMELVDWCRYVVGSPPGWVTGMIHRTASSAVEENYQMMSLGFPDPEQSGCDAVAQISCGRYIPGRWREAIAYRPLASLQVSCRHGIAFVDLPSTLVWFDEAGRHQESLESERPVGERLADPISPLRHQPGPQDQRPGRHLHAPFRSSNRPAAATRKGDGLSWSWSRGWRLGIHARSRRRRKRVVNDPALTVRAKQM